jgi:hypothetical protein
MRKGNGSLSDSLSQKGKVIMSKMETLSKIVKTKSDFVDFDSFFDYYESQWKDTSICGENREKFDVEDLDFIENNTNSLLVRDNPKVLKFKEIVERKLLKVMKEYFVTSNEDLTKSNVRRYFNGYKKWCNKPVVPMYYFITDEDYHNLIKEGYENDVVELLIPIRTHFNHSHGLYCCLDAVHYIMDDFTEEMLSSDIKTITRKLLPI